MILHCFLKQRLLHHNMMKLIRTHKPFKVFCKAHGINEREYDFVNVEYHAVDNELVFEYERKDTIDNRTGVIFSSKAGYSKLSSTVPTDIAWAANNGRLLSGYRGISWKLINLLFHRQIGRIVKLSKYHDGEMVYLTGICKIGTGEYRPADLSYDELKDRKLYNHVKEAGQVLANVRLEQMMKEPAVSEGSNIMMPEELHKIVKFTAQQYAVKCDQCADWKLATYEVYWSDRSLRVCDEHLAAAKEAAANDGPDSDDNPCVVNLNQPTIER